MFPTGHLKTQRADLRITFNKKKKTHKPPKKPQTKEPNYDVFFYA